MLFRSLLVKAFVKQGLDLDRNSVCMPSNLIEAATEVQRYKINNRYLAYLNFVRCLVIFVLKQGAAALLCTLLPCSYFERSSKNTVLPSLYK